jgi:hypothetical protein
MRAAVVDSFRLKSGLRQYLGHLLGLHVDDQARRGVAAARAGASPSGPRAAGFRIGVSGYRQNKRYEYKRRYLEKTHGNLSSLQASNISNCFMAPGKGNLLPSRR